MASAVLRAVQGAVLVALLLPKASAFDPPPPPIQFNIGDSGTFYASYGVSGFGSAVVRIPRRRCELALLPRRPWCA